MFDTTSALVKVLKKGYVYRVTGKQGTGECVFFCYSCFVQVQMLKELSAIDPQGAPSSGSWNGVPGHGGLESAGQAG